MNSFNKCSKDCCFNTTPLKRFNSKLISVDEEGNFYCQECYQSLFNDEETLIKMTIDNYNHYLNNKDFYKNIGAPFRLDEIIKYKYLNQYITPQIPINDEKIFKDGKTFLLIEEDAYLSLEILLWKKHLTFEKLISERKQKLDKQTPKKSNEEEKEENLRLAEERKKEKKEEILINQQIRKNRRNNEYAKQRREQKLEEYKSHKLPDDCKEKKIMNCDYCKGDCCFPFEFSISRIQPERIKAFKGIICDGCIIEKEDEKKSKIEECACGAKFYNFSQYHEKQHYNTKKHKDWNNLVNRRSVAHSPPFTIYNLKQLKKICALNTDENGNLIIQDYYKMKKAELLTKLIDLYKEGKLKIKCLDDSEDEDFNNDDD